MEKNSVFTGIVVGIIVPVLGFVMAETLFDTLTTMGVMEDVTMSTATKRFRTLVLIGICFNLLPLHFFKSRGWDQSMRGVVFPTLVYAASWVWKFGLHLLGF